MNGQYTSLNDAAIVDAGLSAGTTEIWYAKNPTFSVGEAQSIAEGYRESHAMVGSIAETDPELIFSLMQGEVWSRNGEARSLIPAKGLRHTSMSVGDLIVIGDMILVCDIDGWLQISMGLFTPYQG